MLYKWLVEDKSNLSELLFRLLLRMIRTLNYYNYNIYKKNGEQLIEDLVNLVENKEWIEGIYANYYFHAYPGDFIIVPYPGIIVSLFFPKSQAFKFETPI